MTRRTPGSTLFPYTTLFRSGYEVAERIRAIDPKVLIFFLTDRTEKNDRLKGFSLKGNDYLGKPFYPEELLARIEERFSMNESETIEEEVYHFGETTYLQTMT